MPVAAIASMLAMVGGGCSNIQRLDVPEVNGKPSVRSIVQRIRCELGQLLDADYPNHAILTEGDFLVALQLSLTVNDDGSLSPSFLYVENSMFSFNAGIRIEGSREQNFTEKLVYSFRQMQQEREAFRKDGQADPYSCTGPVDTWLAGELGLKASADIAFRTPDVNYQTKLSGTDGAFGGSVNFTITKNLNSVGPTWTLLRFRGPGSFAGLSEVNTDKLTFAFAQSAATGANPRTPPTAKVELLLNQILTDAISTQLSEMRSGLR